MEICRRMVLQLCMALVLVSVVCSNRLKPKHLHCRDPDLGGQAPTNKISQRKFLVISGSGAGLGNYLIFYPAAYYFAALTGRDILLQDGSLIAEMCQVIVCGFPLYSEMASTFPNVLDQDKLNHIRGVKAWDMQLHVKGDTILNDQLLRADGYKYMSGWYLELNHTSDCIQQLTGCAVDDVSCHDRHALQRLVRGPFKSQFRQFEEDRVIGVPPNLKHGLMTLPHSYAPRLDACIHLRCQFKHFEYLVGPEDTLWPHYVKEVSDFLASTDFNAGMQLFKIIEQKIMDELHLILSERTTRNRQRRLLIDQYNEYAEQLNRDGLARQAGEGGEAAGDRESLGTRGRSSGILRRHRRQLKEDVSQLNSTQLDYLSEHSTYKGDAEDRIYVYLASDNERVKEALAAYLLGHTHISVMRVKNEHGHIVHAKNVQYLKDNANSTGVINLALDWYSMSLSNVVFAWRRDTDLLSTFAQSAQRVSGNIEQIDSKIHLDDEGGSGGNSTGSTASETALPRSKGFQLVFKNGRTIWREF